MVKVINLNMLDYVAIVIPPACLHKNASNYKMNDGHDFTSYYYTFRKNMAERKNLFILINGQAPT